MQPATLPCFVKLNISFISACPRTLSSNIGSNKPSNSSLIRSKISYMILNVSHLIEDLSNNFFTLGSISVEKPKIID